MKPVPYIIKKNLLIHRGYHQIFPVAVLHGVRVVFTDVNSCLQDCLQFTSGFTRLSRM